MTQRWRHNIKPESDISAEGATPAEVAMLATQCLDEKDREIHELKLDADMWRNIADYRKTKIDDLEQRVANARTLLG